MEEADLCLYLDILFPEPDSCLTQRTREQFITLQKSLPPGNEALLRKTLQFMNERSITEASIYSYFAGVRIDSPTNSSIVYRDVIISLER